MGIEGDKWVEALLKCIGVNPDGSDTTPASMGSEGGDSEFRGPVWPEIDLILSEDGSLSAAKNTMGIAEREVGYVEGTLKFTGFDSCFGVVVREGNQVRGVQLAIMKPDDTFFNEHDAENVIASLGTYSEAFIMGQIGGWTDPTNKVSAAFKVLEDGIKSGVADGGSYNS